VIAADDILLIDDETRVLFRRLSQLRTMRRWCPTSQRHAFDGLIDRTVRDMRRRMFGGGARSLPAPSRKPKRPGGDWRKP